MSSGITSLLIAGLCYFTYTRWQNRFVLTTGQGDFSLVAQPADDAAMQQLVADLLAHTKAYLHKRYVYPGQELVIKKEFRACIGYTSAKSSQRKRFRPA